MNDIYDEALKTTQLGYNCAETVMLMTGKYFLPDIDFPYSNLVTGFGGGVGRSREECCGALTGSVVALSMLVGRADAQANVDPIHVMISGFRDVFKKEFSGKTVCEHIREGYEGDAAKEMCHDLTAKTVVLLFDYLESLEIQRKI